MVRESVSETVFDCALIRESGLGPDLFTGSAKPDLMMAFGRNDDGAPIKFCLRACHPLHFDGEASWTAVTGSSWFHAPAQPRSYSPKS
jgi:hypothetical protein